MAKKMTPMLQQYFDIKKEHPNAYLFFRLGDFYEMFGDDAKEVSKLLGLTLTARQKGTENEIAMCGVPHHSAERYIAQLTKLGKRVAMCEQVSDPSLPGIVKREVVKIITPGTTLDETISDTKKNNYILSVSRDDEKFAVSFLDIATGEFRTADQKTLQELYNLLYMLQPTEIISEKDIELSGHEIIQHEFPYFEDAEQYLMQHFGVSSLSGFGIASKSHCIKPAALLLHYVKHTQKTALDHIHNLLPYRFQDIMVLDESTIRNLELFFTSKDGKQEGSLLKVIDQTQTRMGARKLRHWMMTPLTDKRKIDERLEATTQLLEDTQKRSEIQSELKQYHDLERLVGKIGCRSVNARDLNYLKANTHTIPIIKNLLSSCDTQGLRNIYDGLNELKELVNIFDDRLHPEPPVTITDGGIIADGFHEELDELRSVLRNGKEWLMNYQQQLRDELDISTLKVKFNKVFGYHIEVTKAQSEKVPEHFHLKQTLVNAHRYMSSQLSEFAEKYLNAEEKIKALEYELFQELIEKTLPYLKDIQSNADLIAQLDIFQSFAQLAEEKHYCRPLLQEKIGIEITEGRHPVIESMLKKNHQEYIANDTRLDEDRQLIVLTGPNMAGKSSYLRQTALIVLLSHMGSFVPAASAKIGITDRIFTRVGASDDISTGQSTFMVEMTEAANILNNATERSLIIFDELGRGTSTYDGVSIAWSVLEYVAQELKALTLFATHYHELIDVAKAIPQAANASIAVAEKNGEVTFLRKVVDQGVDRSYGIEVAKLAGLPLSVINRAKDILTELEKDRAQEENTLLGLQPSLFSTPAQAPQHNSEQNPHRKIIDQLHERDPNTMTPLDALQFLHEIKKEL